VLPIAKRGRLKDDEVEQSYCVSNEAPRTAVANARLTPY
jgi:hypothetical protein